MEPHLAGLESFPLYADFVLAGLATHYGPWGYVPVTAYQRRERDYYVDHRRPIDAEVRERPRPGGAALIAAPPHPGHPPCRS